MKKSPKMVHRILGTLHFDINEIHIIEYTRYTDKSNSNKDCMDIKMYTL